MGEGFVEPILRRVGYFWARVGGETQMPRLMRSGTDTYLPDLLAWRQENKEVFRVLSDATTGDNLRGGNWASSCGARLPPAAALPPPERGAPARQERDDERVFLRRLDGERREGQRGRERDVVALRAGGHGAAVRRVGLVDPHGRFHQPGQLRVVRARFELDAEAVARWPARAARRRAGSPGSRASPHRASWRETASWTALRYAR